MTLAVVAVIGAPMVAGQSSVSGSCEPVSGTHVCVTNVSVSDDTLTQGKEGTLSFTVRNFGNDSATVRLVLAVVGPNNETQLLELRKKKPSVRTLDPGASRTFEQPLDPQTIGVHGIEVRLLLPNENTRLATADPVTIEVVSSRGLGGPIDRTELAVVALVGALAVMAYLVRRQS